MIYQIKKLGDIADFSQGLQVPIENQLEKYQSDLARFIRIVDYTNENEPLRYINKPSDKYFVDCDDIVMIRYGSQTAGKVVRGISGIIANNTFKINITDKGINKDYLFRFLSQNRIYKELNSGQGSSTMPAVSFGIVKNILIEYSSLETQKRIASILSNYDDLIENNLKRITLLEETAQNIYKEWFVNFRFPNYEHTEFDAESGLPVGWEVFKLNHFIDYHIGGGWGNEIQDGEYTDPAYVLRGTDMPDFKTGQFSKIPFRFHKSSNLKSRKIQVNDIVFEVSGGSAKYPVGRSLILNSKILENFENESIMCASFCKLIRPNSEIISPIFLSMFLDSIYFNGTIAQYENRSASNIVNFKFETFIEKQEVFLPTKEVLTEFSNLITPIYDLITVLGIKISKLKEARDILLPRLMNRTIEV